MIIKIVNLIRTLVLALYNFISVIYWNSHDWNKNLDNNNVNPFEKRILGIKNFYKIDTKTKITKAVSNLLKFNFGSYGFASERLLLILAIAKCLHGSNNISSIIEVSKEIAFVSLLHEYWTIKKKLQYVRMKLLDLSIQNLAYAQMFSGKY